ncbi:MAG: hypothetical protein MRERC_1c037 [Mycoplasmataceae bacterium RC_NB112A]|nr:MAG: hypothetical protein MRERC_10c022 [Mycoplasmataceae bacterium RC_NB112A]KLL01957.1 MAG: hypothetical protein MRERC_6c047 [Mycoplasmataceae bacterium RC_NB112A]KLL02455.1 MAG: hypothetical protein MRERC_1c037 [Mycoplasmataceae bacterium RC_NB112A]
MKRSDKVKKINKETDLTNLIKAESVPAAYSEVKVPESRNYKNVKELFRIALEKPTPAGLNPEKIELWRTTGTGLSKNGTEERKVFDNGWNDYVNKLC